MNTIRITPVRPRRRPWLRTAALALLLGMAAPAGQALPSPAPVAAAAAGLTLASVLTYVATVSGTVSMLTSVATYLGDFEEQDTQVRVKSYYDQCDGLYGGLRWVQTRRYSINPAGDAVYETTMIYRYPDGRTEWTTNRDIFDYRREQRDFYCSPQQGYWYRVLSRTELVVGYEVLKPARMAKHVAPNPLPVTIGFWGIPLQISCSDQPEYTWHESREARAPRRAFAKVPFPRNNLEITRVELTPRLK